MLMMDNKMWSDPVTEKPELDTIEVWNIINTFSELNINHPIHLHLILVHFTGYPGDYVWHCHFLEHEDHDMMRPMKVIDNSFKSN